MENLYGEQHASGTHTDETKWEEQVIEGSAEDDIFMQEFVDSKVTKNDSLKEEIVESTVDELPKPSPRYGHAACKYQGSCIC